MAVASTSLISLEEFNDALQKGSDGGKIDERKEGVIDRVSVEIETFLDRHFVTASYTEYHTAHSEQNELLLGEWPVTAVASVYEDSGWMTATLANRYPSTTLLVADTDYLVIKPTREPSPFGKLLKLTGYWSTTRRAIKVAYTAGYANTAAVPKPVKAVALELASLVWRDQDQHEIGVISRTDSAGTSTRNLPALLTQEMQRRLTPYKRIDFASTWERDAA